MSTNKRWEKFGRERNSSESSESDDDTSPISYDRPATNYELDGSAIGPTLPPHLMKQRSSPDKNETNNERSEASEVIGPALPPLLKREGLHTVPETNKPGPYSSILPSNVSADDLPAGPFLPPHLQIKTKHEVNNSLTIGPALPPHLLSKMASDSLTEDENASSSIGPALPPHLLHKNESGRIADTRSRILGPQLPPGFVPVDESDESSEEEPGIGPDPRLMAEDGFSFNQDVDKRALKAKRKLLGLDKDEKVERESWMLDLPPERAANLGLGPRQFRAKLAPEMGDRTVWTDTPQDKERKTKLPPKVDEKDMMRKEVIAERDREMEKMAKKAEKKLKRKEALLVTHTKEMKKKAKKEAKEKEGQPVERKRFNREEDMQVHRFDEAQKKAIFKKAQMLNDRFSRGESKFL